MSNSHAVLPPFRARLCEPFGSPQPLPSDPPKGSGPSPTTNHGPPLLPSSAEPRYFAIEAAAAILSLKPHALRARCRRRAKKEGRNIVAHLGGGILAIKFGVTWRVRFPE